MKILNINYIIYNTIATIVALAITNLLNVYINYTISVITYSILCILLMSPLVRNIFDGN